MSFFIKSNKNLITYSLLLFLVIPIFGFNFLISFLSNILLLIFLIPLLLILIAFIGFNSLKSKIKTCSECGAISLESNSSCMNCGANLKNIEFKNENFSNDPSNKTIEIIAEEIN